MIDCVVFDIVRESLYTMSMNFANCEFRSAVYRFDHTVTDAFFGKFMSYSCDELVTGCPSVVLVDFVVKCYD